MMKKIVVVFLLFIACKKQEQTAIPDPVIISKPNEPTHALLKDIVIPNLPSPYYHFVYDSSKRVSQISFASDLYVYNLEYDHNLIQRIFNSSNNNRLEYAYTNNNVSLITEFSGATGDKRWEYIFDYDTSNHLSTIQWWRFNNTNTTGILYRKSTLAYYADGNLWGIDNYFSNERGELAWSSKSQYANYDSGINVDGFSVFKNFFETLLVLPSVTLQHNNPGTEIITSVFNDYNITYTYRYEDSLPTVKLGLLVQTRGSDSIETFNISSRFSYY